VGAFNGVALQHTWSMLTPAVNHKLLIDFGRTLYARKLSQSGSVIAATHEHFAVYLTNAVESSHGITGACGRAQALAATQRRSRRLQLSLLHFSPEKRSMSKSSAKVFKVAAGDRKAERANAKPYSKPKSGPVKE
jgi:hypothetical protein